MNELHVDKVLAYPPNVTTSQIDLFDGKTLDIPKEAYYEGRPIDSVISSHTLDLTPPPSTSLNNSIPIWIPKKAIQNQTNHDIACLLYLKETGHPKGITTGDVPSTIHSLIKNQLPNLKNASVRQQTKKRKIAHRPRSTRHRYRYYP